MGEQKKTRQQIAQETFEGLHQKGAEAFGGLWLTVNDAAVDAIRLTGGDPANLETKALVSAVLFRTLSRLKRIGALQ
jgi:hypothetical protein